MAVRKAARTSAQTLAAQNRSAGAANTSILTRGVFAVCFFARCDLTPLLPKRGNAVSQRIYNQQVQARQLRKPTEAIQIQLNDLPTIRGRDGAVDYLNDVFGVPITPTRMRTAIEGRELPVYKISGCNYFSERDLYLWVKSLARPTVRRGPDAA
ncbi:MAG: hypothetical protein QM809_18725 [Gordonia sp. (in: high G+C Gram-positive bacteria)]|uniref:hypothetical protein n=1 Tax=Gordonia sp. (in: high G+C Gram-positive bacteria) TaxID=84139 RepID=UPI0039E5A5B0